MRLAAIADIHGNALALEAVLADLAQLQLNGFRVDAVVNLGDHLSGPLEARRTADLLMALDFPSIRGNHDRALIEQHPSQMGLSDSAADAQLEAAHRAWLGSMPQTMMFRSEVFLCHGTPVSDSTYWLEQVTPDGYTRTNSIEAIERLAAGIECSLILCGHTHIPRAVRLSDGRLIVNPGSVGCPAYCDDTPVPHASESGLPDACYALLEKRHSQWAATFRHVPYDHAAMAALARSGGRLDWASGIATGWLR
jgi:putative phosphoesterase